MSATHAAPWVSGQCYGSGVQVHLLDATYEIFRAHFGRPPSKGPDGREVGATIGVVESVLGLLREPGVTHLACATDHVIRSWRNERWPGSSSWRTRCAPAGWSSGRWSSTRPTTPSVPPRHAGVPTHWSSVWSS